MLLQFLSLNLLSIWLTMLVLPHQGGARSKRPAERNLYTRLKDGFPLNLLARPHRIYFWIDTVRFYFNRALDATNGPGLGSADGCSWSQLLAARDNEIKEFKNQQVIEALIVTCTPQAVSDIPPSLHSALAPAILTKTTVSNALTPTLLSCSDTVDGSRASSSRSYTATIGCCCTFTFWFVFG